MLDPSDRGALTVTGNGSVLASNDARVVVNSSSPGAAVATGRARVSATEIDVHGSPGAVTTGSARFIGAVYGGAPAQADPFAELVAPPAPAPTFAAVDYSGQLPLTLSPGTYVGGIEVSGPGAVTLLPGVYYLRGGGLAVTGQGRVSGDGVLVYDEEGIDITGQGSLRLTPPTAGPYKGITLFQGGTSESSINITGSASVDIVGTVYAPGAELNITGNGTLVGLSDPANLIGSEFVLNELNVTGNGSLQIDAHYNNPLTLAFNLSPTPLPLPGGTLVTNAVQGMLVGTTRPLASMRLETGSDGLFDDGSTTADAAGHFSLAVTLSPGPNLLQVRASDDLNDVLTQSLQVSLDVQPPQITVITPTSGFPTNASVAVTGTVTDNLSGVASLQAKVDAGAFFSVTPSPAGAFSFPVAANGLTDGTHTVALQAFDRAGNASAVQSVSFMLDRVAPTISITSPVPGLITNQSVMVSGLATDDRSGLASMQAALDGGAYAPVSYDAAGYFSFPVSAAALADGTHTIALQAFDQAGNASAVQTVSILLDRVAPTVTVISPDAGLTADQNITVSGVASDDRTGLAALQVSFDGGAYTPLTYDVTGHFSFPTGLPLDGTADVSHTVHVRAVDVAGNVSAVTDFSFILDTTAPVVTVTSPAAGLTVTQNVTVTGHVSDALSGIASAESALDGGAFAPLSLDAGGNFSLTTNLPLDDSADGPHTIHLRATDRVGNVSAQTDFPFVLEVCAGFTGASTGQSGGSPAGQGSVTINDCDATLREGDSFDVTLTQPVTIPTQASTLSFDYSNLAFDTTSQGRVKDAFEVALVDASGNSLVPTIAANRDAFLNISEGQPAALGAWATSAGQTVTLDVSHVTPGTAATLLFRLVNNDGDVNTSVVVGSVRVAPLTGQPVDPGGQPAAPAASSPAEIDFAHLADVSASIQPLYGRTSFDQPDGVLYADLAAQNAGQYFVDAPLIVAIDHLSDPSVRVRGTDGMTPDGLP